jgi:2-phosphosulfolactate phosphatase
MRITVALTPGLLRDPSASAVGVVDVLRASSSLVTMFERGLLRALIAGTLNEARQLALRNFSLLCGEIKSVPAPGFDYGNSPAQYAEVSLKGKSAVLFTTNGTRAIRAAAQAPVVAVASLLNRRAAAARLLDEATRRNLDIALVCAGRERGLAFSLEDSIAAGAMVEATHEADPAVLLTDEAWAAYHLWRWYRGDAMRAFRQSAHGRALLGLGFEDDLRFAAQLDAFDTVPMLYRDGDVMEVRTRPRRRGSEATPA